MVSCARVSKNIQCLTAAWLLLRDQAIITALTICYRPCPRPPTPFVQLPLVAHAITAQPTNGVILRWSSQNQYQLPTSPSAQTVLTSFRLSGPVVERSGTMCLRPASHTWYVCAIGIRTLQSTRI